MIGLLALLDDIALAMKKIALQSDDIAVMAKTATKNTAGILGDDIALNAKELQGVGNDHELRVIGRVFKGALINKIIIIPFALLLSSFLPLAFKGVLVIGGLYLCYEGAEKVVHKLAGLKNKKRESQELKPPVDLEKKVKGAIRTDFILSIEIVAIILASLEAFGELEILNKIITVSLTALAITIGIYGIVLLVVKIDDLGLYLLKKETKVLKLAGHSLLVFAPKLMLAIGLAGTLAMFMVGGELIIHQLHIPMPNFNEVAQTLAFGFVTGLLLVGIKGLAGALVSKTNP